MSNETITTLIGLTLFAGWAGMIAILVVPSLRSRVAPYALWLAGAVAIGATVGSLWFSEGAGFIPCKLCWYQRIAMYPLAVILPMAAIRRDRPIFKYVLVLAGIGIAIAAYHVWIQLFPEDSNFCTIADPCTAKWVEAFGWLTIPQMAGLSFGLIIALGAVSLWEGRAPTESVEDEDAEDQELEPA